MSYHHHFSGMPQNDNDVTPHLSVYYLLHKGTVNIHVYCKCRYVNASLINFGNFTQKTLFMEPNIGSFEGSKTHS